VVYRIPARAEHDSARTSVQLSKPSYTHHAMEVARERALTRYLKSWWANRARRWNKE
jgi:hypothetical protein